MKNKRRGKLKALVLFSGGLDSLITVQLLRKQGIVVEGVTFESPFFDAQKAKKFAKKINLPLIVVDISKEFIKILKNPKFGYGKHLNPCLDCRILMLKTAKKILKEKGFNLIATGEVLDQRPFTQNKQALELTAKEAGLRKILLRPLSAKLLPPTLLEKKGLIKRELLLSLRGRSRKKQLELAKKLKIKEWPTPSGGCLLTYKEYAQKAKSLLKLLKNPKPEDFQLLKIGRHFFEKKTWIIVGRNEEENKKLAKVEKPTGILIEPVSPGPAIFFPHKNKATKQLLEEAFRFIERYSKKK